MVLKYISLLVCKQNIILLQGILFTGFRHINNHVIFKLLLLKLSIYAV